MYACTCICVGAPGEQGRDGSDGDPGPQGVNGEKGEPGEDGESLMWGSCSFFQHMLIMSSLLYRIW